MVFVFFLSVEAIYPFFIFYFDSDVVRAENINWSLRGNGAGSDNNNAGTRSLLAVSIINIAKRSNV